MRLKSNLKTGIMILVTLTILFAFSCKEEPAIGFKSGTFRGTVELPQGATYGLSDVLIYVEEQPGFMERANADGSFVLTGLEDGAFYTLTFTTKAKGVTRAVEEPLEEQVPGYAQLVEGAKATAGEGTLLPRVALKQMGIIKGQVQLDGQEDHAGIDVYVPGTSFGAKTDENGFFKISYVPQGRYRVRMEKPQWQVVYSDYFLVEESDGDTVPITELSGVTVLRKAYGTVTGTIHLSGYQDDKSGTVILLKHVSDTEAVYVGSTSPDGSFTVSNIIPGTYEITISHSGFVTMVSEATLEASEIFVHDPMTLVAAGGTIDGEVKLTDKDDHTGILVLAVHEKGLPRYSTVTDADGKFVFQHALPGFYTLTASKDGYIHASRNSGEVVPGKTKAIVFNPLASIYGMVEGKATLAGLADHEGIQVVARPVGDGDSRTALANAQGDFTITGIMPGSYTLEISRIGYATQKTAAIEVTSGVTFRVPDFELVPSSGGLSGLVLLSGETNYSGTIIVATSTVDEAQKYNTVALEDGSYHINGMKGGEYSLSFQRTGFITDNSQMITIDLGKNASVPDVVMQTSTANVRGQVSLEGAATFEGVSVLLQDGDNLSYSTTTDQEGNFVINKVRPGTYLFSVSKAGYANKSVSDVMVVTGIDTSIDSLSLPVAVRSVTGGATLELRSDHDGILVTATNISDTKLIYSAITNSSGMYTLAGMVPGEYNISLSKEGYRTLTLPTVNVMAGSAVSLEIDELKIARGSVTGLVKLEGRIDMSGTIVSLVGTDYETTTDEAGIYTFLVPAGNYPGGVRFTRTDFETASDTNTITVMTDSTYAIPEKSLKATHASIMGQVDVMGTGDESGATVSIDGTSFTMITAADGRYRFDHVPLGEHVVRFTYDSTPAVTAHPNLGPTEIVDLGTITLRPNQASITGFVTLEGLTSFAGISITAKNVETEELLSTKTSTDGSFTLGGLLTTGTYVVDFSKPGWVSQNMIVASLVPLEVRDITSESPIELIDTTPPVINSVTINDGGNTTSNPEVTLNIDAFDYGSGIRKVRISWDGTFDSEAWMLYAPILESTIPDTANGNKTVWVQIQDFNGLQSIDTTTATIRLTDQVKAVSGILEDADLHWTKTNSPILVAGDIIVPQNKTLVIDPGVDVQFNGVYSISIRGTLSAVGTEAEPIVFKPAAEQGYSGRWNGIDAGPNTLVVDETAYAFTLNQGSVIQHARILGTENGIRGRILLKDSYVETDGYALGGSSGAFTGYAVGNDIRGSVSAGDWSDSALLFGNEFHGKSGWGFSAGAQVRMVNNLVQGYSSVYLYCLSRFDFNTIRSAQSLAIEGGYGYLQSTPTNNEISDIANTMTLQNNDSLFRDMRFSNIQDNLGNPELRVNTAWNSLGRHDWRYNYWGAAHTAELESLRAANRNNASFIHDGNDNADLSNLDYDGFVSEPWESAGYRGDGFADFSATFVSKAVWGYNEAKIGEPIELRLESLTGSDVAEYRIGQSVERLNAAAWKPYGGAALYDGVDAALMREGYVDLIVQVRDERGNASAVKMLSVGYEAPKFTEVSVANGARYTGDNPVTVNTKFTDNIGAYGYHVWLDDVLFVDIPNNWYGPNAEDTRTLEVKAIGNGEHTLKFEIGDMAGNTTMMTRTFTVERPVPVASNILFTNETNIAEGESLEFSINISQATHLKTLRVLANGNEMKKVSYVDNGQSSFTYSASIPSVYIPNGESSLSIELTDYADNVASYDLGTFTVGGTGISPTITEVSIADGTTFTSLTDTNLSFTASDTGGVRLVRALLNGEEIRPSYALPYNDVLKERKITWPMNIPFRKNGTYTLTIEATDFAGYKTVDERTIIIDRVVPTATMQLSSRDLSDGQTFRVDANIQNAQSLAYYQVLIDGHQLTYSGYHGMYLERTPFNQNWTFDVEDLPAGTFQVKVKVVDVAGNVTETANQAITVHRTIHNSDYGLGVTWNADGTLMPDWTTHYLWNFDNPASRGLDVAGGVLSGQVYETTDGLGSTAARMYLNKNVETQFPDASWTVEFWGKMENPTTVSNIHLNLNNVFYTYVNKESATNSSYAYGYYTYLTPGGVDLSNNNIYSYSSREARNEWHHYAFVSTGNELYFYIDGLPMGKLEDKMSNTIATQLHINSYEYNYMDEIRISMRARSVDELWSYVQYAKQWLPAD